ncbi:phosphoglycerate kinase, cytosolic [Nicotiana attenuata]|uniref:Phosphoglycerate kinase n=1 Tax=Nicotiana attenuata TaxID=49451 RepID=A0A1J6IKP1_NICAT|nr:phosphoglycerate kinase, cytosolic [Nicotiana attenuata]
MADDCIGREVEDMICKMPSGGVLLLENVRFNRGEMACEQEFAKKLAPIANYYVNDCFRTSNKPHASNEGVTQYLPGVAGLLMKKELRYLSEDVANVKKPFHAIVGGSRLSTRIGVIENLFDNKVDVIFFGGGLIFTFLAAAGYSVGSSLVEENMLRRANLIVSKAIERGVRLVFPADYSRMIVKPGNIHKKFIGLDIGPDTVSLFSRVLDEAKTIIWNGPMGGFEIAEFAGGTEGIAKKLANVEEAISTIIVGGSSAAAVKILGLAEKMTHVSTGGFASLELLEGIPPSGICGLQDERRWVCSEDG